MARTDIEDVCVGGLGGDADVLSRADSDPAAALTSRSPSAVEVATAIQSSRCYIVTLVPTIGKRDVYTACRHGGPSY